MDLINKDYISINNCGQASLQILMFCLVLSSIAAPLYLIPSILEEQNTSGDISFFDDGGNPLSGTIELKGKEVSSYQERNINIVRWDNVTSAEISYSLLQTENISIELEISNDSQNGRITIKDHGINNPSRVSAPGTVLKYIETGSTGVALHLANISIQYTDAQVNGLDEQTLVLYGFDRENFSWQELPTTILEKNNILSTKVNALTIFAVVSPEKAVGSGIIEVRDTKKNPVMSDIKTFDDNKTLKRSENASALSEITQNGDIEVDAMASKNVAVKLKAASSNGGEIILDDVGGADCVNCHDIGTSVNKQINVSAMNETGAVHKYLNNDTSANNSSSYYANNKRCWACHGDGTEPGGSHPSNFNNPYVCGDCHNRTSNLLYTNSTRNVSLTKKSVVEHLQSPYYEEISSTVVSSNATCLGCHNRSLNSFNDTGFNLSANISHYASVTNLVSPTVNCSYCHKNAANASAYWANTVRHAAKSGADSFCANCHNTTNATTFHSRLLVMPDSVHGGSSGHGGERIGRGFDWENDDFSETGLSPEREACVACHGAIADTCISCHPVGPILVPKLCENCHLPNTISLFTGPTQSALYNLRNDINDTLPRVYAHTNYSNITNIIVPAQMGGDGRYTTTCYTFESTGGTCHAAPYFNRASFGGYYAQRASDTSGFVGWGDPAHWTQTVDRMPNTTNCLFCHNQSDTTIKQNWGSAMQVNATNMFGNRYTINNPSCYICHTRNSTKPFDFHSSEVVEGGGPGCLGCHNNSNPQNFSDKYGNTMRYINGANFSLSVHAGMNANNASGYGINASCWACHNSTGYPVANNTHPDNSTTPYNCTDCHLTSGGKAGAYNATIVYEHFRGGTDINAGNSSSNISSCINCHENVSEMLISNNDTDYGTFAGDGIGLNGGDRSYYHYGKNRSDLRTNGGTNTNCSYCHQNASTAFAPAMIDLSYNSNISNHSLRYNSSNPVCTQCHSTGWIHNETLTKPGLTLPDSVSCNYCHGSSGSATIRNLIKHNNNVDCSSCHLDTGRDIHPVKYLQPGASFTTSISTAVNCTNCHQSLMPGFETAPIIPSVLKHSSDIRNGSIWNLSTTPYWTSNSGSCYYCHTNTKHNSTALGTITSLLSDTNNTRNGTLTVTQWCSDCHLNGTNPDYNGILWTPVPPLITIDNTGKSFWVDHSTYFGSGIKDSSCRSCHVMNGNYAATSLNYSHSLDPGTSGPDCISCHDTGRSAERRINNSAMNGSDSVHSTLNSNAARSSWISAENKKCWGCHDSTGTQPSNDSMGSRYSDPYKCFDCHNSTSKPYPNVSTAPNVTEHFKGGDQIKAASSASDKSLSCLVCHNLSELKVSYTEDDTYNTNYSLSSHYARNRTDLRTWNSNQAVNCSYCHQNNTTVFSGAMVDASYNSSIINHSTSTSSPSCYNSTCHGSGWIHNSTLTRPSFSVPNSSYCTNSGCHATTEKHNGSVNCTQCHLNTRRSIHSVKYLQNDGSSWSTTNSTAVNCTNCHQRNISDFANAKQVPQLKHSSDPSSGMKWGNYWKNNSAVIACYYCHQSQIHLATGLLGNITSIKGSNTYNNQDIDNSTWCANCHYASTSQYNGTIFNPVPPEITNSSLTSSDGTSFYNHSGFASYNDSGCNVCHGAELSGYIVTSRNFSHSVSEGGGGPDCISCHDINGTGAPSNKRINYASIKLGVHKDLNSNAINSTAVDPINKACWACHGEGNESGGHPARYQNPRECSNNDCHALSQLFKAPMVYSHFKDAQLNDNPTDVLNYNVSTRSLCEDCHYNSLVLPNEPKGNSSVSHYASTDKLIESVNCIYCHLDEDNAKDWGNATEINKNRTAMIQINRENNKFTAITGEMIDLGTGYRIKVTDISTDRGSAAIEVYKLDTLVDRGLVKIGEYILEENLVIDNSTVKTPVIVLNITNMFVSLNGSFIQFNGSRIKRVHPENRTTSCISCHYKGSAKKHKYVVIDREDEDVYYTEVIFNSSDKELYDQEKFQKLLLTLTPLDKYLDIQTPLRTTMKQGAPWDIGKDYRLTLREVATDSKTALFELEIGGRTYTDIVRKGEKLEYNLSINYLGNTYTEVEIFNATVKEIAQANPNIVILENIKALSPEIMSVKDNTTLYGYNTSWFWVDNTFMTGRIPQNLHVPLLFDGKVGGPDCVSCHGQKDLGKHKVMNVNTSSGIASQNKACWICHGDGNEPKGHPVTYNKPRICKSCHADRIEPYYNATYIGDENHRNLPDCSICHVVDTHKIVRYDVMPGIKEISVSKDEIYPGEEITLKATAIAGFNMRLKAVEYYIDSPEKKLAMVPVDGSFDGQREDATAQVITSELKVGEHMIYVRAMERNDKWGPESSITFDIKDNGINISEEEEEKKSDGVLYGISGTILSLIMGYSIRKYLMKR